MCENSDLAWLWVGRVDQLYWLLPSSERPFALTFDESLNPTRWPPQWLLRVLHPSTSPIVTLGIISWDVPKVFCLQWSIQRHCLGPHALAILRSLVTGELVTFAILTFDQPGKHELLTVELIVGSSGRAGWCRFRLGTSPIGQLVGIADTTETCIVIITVLSIESVALCLYGVLWPKPQVPNESLILVLIAVNSGCLLVEPVCLTTIAVQCATELIIVSVVVEVESTIGGALLIRVEGIRSLIGRRYRSTLVSKPVKVVVEKWWLPTRSEEVPNAFKEAVLGSGHCDHCQEEKQILPIHPLYLGKINELLLIIVAIGWNKCILETAYFFIELADP